MVCALARHWKACELQTDQGVAHTNRHLAVPNSQNDLLYNPRGSVHVIMPRQSSLRGGEVGEVGGAKAHGDLNCELAPCCEDGAVLSVVASLV